MKKFVAVFIGLCAALFIACNEDAAPATSAPTETIIDTLYVKVTDTVVNTVVLDSIDTLVIRNYKDVVKRDTIFVEPDFKSSENDSTTIVSFGNTTVTINKATCGDIAYDPEKSFCYEGKLMDVCEGYAYNPKKFFCYEDSLIALCGGESYDPKTSYCSFSGRVLKNDYFLDERDGTSYRYVVIGNQTWMAENLRYAYDAVPIRRPDSSFVLDSLSFCYLDSCEKYGRYYTWSAAIDSAALFSDDGAGCGYFETACNHAKGQRRRGICPEGWHLPKKQEFEELLKYVDDNNGDNSIAMSLGSSDTSLYRNSIKKLPSDDFGFTAVPTSWACVKTVVDNKNCNTKAGAYWWIDYVSEGGHSRLFLNFQDDFYNFMTISLQCGGMVTKSVRCVKDIPF